VWHIAVFDTNAAQCRPADQYCYLSWPIRSAVRVLPLIANFMRHILSLVNVSLFAMPHTIFSVGTAICPEWQQTARGASRHVTFPTTPPALVFCERDLRSWVAGIWICCAVPVCHADTVFDFCCLKWCVRTPSVPTPGALHCVTIIPQSVLRQVNSLFQSEFSTECDLVLPLSISSVLSFPYGHIVAAYVVSLVFPPLLYFLQ
jgi:hypothetical protein